jgi:gluconolactonase
MNRLSVTLLALLVAASAALCADEVPVGVVTHHSFDQSKIFPGTTRDYWVYVPKQYDGSRPACLWVEQDGVQFNAVRLNGTRDAAASAGVFDELIASKQMPLTIGVFVTPGVVKPENADALARFNRSYEYDGLGDGYARFLIDELLPHIVKDQNLNISSDANNRGIGGSSSGAICAFNVAWERPDSFRRVFSNIGTFVGLRGANELRTLVRKYEPKRLRVWLMDGSNDLNIYGGDWWIANQEMERALTFCGYEVNHYWGTGGHSGQDATQKFPEAMAWLWKDWPQPIKAGKGSEQLQQILIPGEEWQLVSDGYRGTEGATSNAAGEVFFDDVPNRKTYKIGLDGKVSLFLADSKGGDGQRFGPDGRLYACAGAARQIMAWDPSGKGMVIAEGFRGNDLVVRHDGGVYVTEPAWTLADPTSKIWFIAPGGEKKVVDTGLKFANGITFSPDQTLLYIDDMKSHWVYSYQVQPDGSLRYKQKYFHLHEPDAADDSGADGMRVDRDGRLYVATRLGIQVCDQAGRVNCIIPTPNGKIANLTFGGAENDTLFCACGDKIYKRKLKVNGVKEFDAPIQPAAPRL